MKNNFLAFILGCAILPLLGVNSGNTTTTVPKVPRLISVREVTGSHSRGEQIKKHIELMHSYGYVVKTVSLGETTAGTPTAIVVMEKY